MSNGNLVIGEFFHLFEVLILYGLMVGMGYGLVCLCVGLPGV